MPQRHRLLNSIYFLLFFLTDMKEDEENVPQQNLHSFPIREREKETHLRAEKTTNLTPEEKISSLLEKDQIFID